MNVSVRTTHKNACLGSILGSACALLALLLCCAAPARAVSCSVSQARRFPETHLPQADAALDQRKPEDAILLYKKALETSPADPSLHAALAEAYLDEQKVADADATITKAIAGNAHSAVLESVLAEVQLDEGRPWDAQDTIARALADDPCYPDAHLTEGQLLTYTSMYGSAAKQYAVAYQLAPHDADFFYEYLRTLPAPQRISLAQTYMEREKADSTGLLFLQRYVARLEKMQSDSQGTCMLAATSPVTTEIPMMPLMGNFQRIRAVGLDVNVDQHPTHLAIDTVGRGLVLSESAAARAGLHYESEFEMRGGGSDGPYKAHLAFAKTVKIGALEFHNCPVSIYERKKLYSFRGRLIDNDDDGEIGMELLSQFLITLDYPRGKLKLAPLPALPNAAQPLGLTSDISQTKPLNAEAIPPLWLDRYISPEMRDYSPALRIGTALIVPASIAKDTVKLFMLGAGSYRTFLTTSAARDVGKLHRDDSEEQVYGLSGMVKDLYYVDQVIFNFAHVSLVTNQALAAEPEALDLDRAPVEVSGVIGASALRQCVVHLDYRDGLVKLDYTPGPSRF